MRPIFIFSLPRSGSTLLQRLLASHKEIGTTSETWLLLPFFYNTHLNGIQAEYSHPMVVRSTTDFFKELPNGKSDYSNELQMFICKLYELAMHDKYSEADQIKYFIDKTPRYDLIVNEIIKTFTTAKFIFIWRNPLSVVSSLIETWGDRWNLDIWDIDLFKGFENLVNTYIENKADVISVNYEELVANPENEIERICSYLELSYSDDLLKNFNSINLKGKSKDPTGINLYSQISSEPLTKWKSVLSPITRKIWVDKYIDWIGEERLSFIGYNFQEIKKDIHLLGNNFFDYRCLSDLPLVIKSYILINLKAYILSNKYRSKDFFDDF